MGALVILGNGAAGTATAMGFRQYNRRDPVYLISRESELLFSRPGLVGVALGQTLPQDLHPLPPAHFDQAGIVRLHSPAVEVQPAARRVRLESGAELAYDHLVLALGRVPRALDFSLSAEAEKEVLRLHAWGDGPRLAAQRGRRWGVVGGGWIGAELAEIASFRGERVHWWMRNSHPGAPWVTPEEGGALVRHHLPANMAVHGDFRLLEASRTAGHWSLRGRDEAGKECTYEVDVFAAGIGVVPDFTSWRHLLGPDAAGVLLGNDGIRVTRALATALPGVWAVGDCVDAEAWSGGLLRSWEMAQRMGLHLGQGLAQDQVTDFVPGVQAMDARLFRKTFAQWGDGREPAAPGEEQTGTVSGWLDVRQLFGVRFHWNAQGALAGVATWDWRLKSEAVKRAISLGYDRERCAAEWRQWSHEPAFRNRPWKVATAALRGSEIIFEND